MKNSAIMGRAQLINRIYELEIQKEDWCNKQCPNKNKRIEIGPNICFGKDQCILFPEDND